MYNSYGVNQETIALKLDIENISQNIDKSINLGLIINELVSNSLKHAFPNGRKGKISIKLFSETNDCLTLFFSDNGIGLPKDLDFQNSKTLGLQLINTLIDELDGTIKLEKRNGTKFKIIFKNINKE